MSSACDGMSGTKPSAATKCPVPCYALATRCPVSSAICLRAGYVMSGTDEAYGAYGGPTARACYYWAWERMSNYAGTKPAIPIRPRYAITLRACCAMSGTKNTMRVPLFSDLPVQLPCDV
eukprot:1082673-Rhodomonas_salina.1